MKILISVAFIVVLIGLLTFLPKLMHSPILAGVMSALILCVLLGLKTLWKND